MAQRLKTQPDEFAGKRRRAPLAHADVGEGSDWELTFGGQPCVLRQLHPADAGGLRDFFYSHTRDTIQMRYGFAVRQMTPERAHELVSVDQSRDLALGVFENTAPPQIIHAVARYCIDPDGRSAEVAFVVRESKRRLGMASTLLRTMIAVAQERGLDFLWAHVDRANAPMLALFQRNGGKLVPTEELRDHEAIVRISLRPEGGRDVVPGRNPAGPPPADAHFPNIRNRPATSS